MTYNGWTNWETWHTKLLIDDEQNTYNKSQVLVKKKASWMEFRRELIQAERDTKKYFNKNVKQPGEKFEKVNWKEIRDSFMEEY